MTLRGARSFWENDAALKRMKRMWAPRTHLLAIFSGNPCIYIYIYIVGGLDRCGSGFQALVLVERKWEFILTAKPIQKRQLEGSRSLVHIVGLKRNPLPNWGGLQHEQSSRGGFLSRHLQIWRARKHGYSIGPTSAKTKHSGGYPATQCVESREVPRLTSSVNLLVVIFERSLLFDSCLSCSRWNQNS